MGTARYKMFFMYKYLYYNIWYINILYGIIYTVGTLQAVACKYNINNIVLLYIYTYTFSEYFSDSVVVNILLLYYNSGILCRPWVSVQSVFHDVSIVSNAVPCIFVIQRKNACVLNFGGVIIQIIRFFNLKNL